MTYGAGHSPPNSEGVAAAVPAAGRAAASKHGSPTSLTLASIVDELGWFVLDLPRPPSVNRFTHRLGNKSPEVLAWVKEADYCVMRVRPRPRFTGPFEIKVTWNVDQFGRFDCDNPIKPLLDYLQRVMIIENDRWCRR